MAAELSSVIVAPSRTNNSLGRATSLAEVFSRVGSVRLLAADDGPLWQGARHTPFQVDSFAGPRELTTAIATIAPSVVVTVKPFARSLTWTVHALKRLRDGQPPPLVADLDDLDVAIHAAWHRDLPPRERVRSLARSELSPLRIAARIRWLLRSASVLTVSSWALRQPFPTFRGPELRLPHPRPARPYEPPSSSARLRLGFLGTPVAYKGVDTLNRLVATRLDTELHVLAGTEAAWTGVPPARLVVHPHAGSETLARAFREIDVVVLPQDPSAPAARYQLPAKLIDALQFGRPVLATDTPPVRELAGPSVRLLPSTERLDPWLAALDALKDRRCREELGRAGTHAWARSFSAAPLADQLAGVLTNVSAAAATAAPSNSIGLHSSAVPHPAPTRPH